MAMSDAELRHRKKLQGHISQTTATLGLTALGTRAAGAKSLGKLTKIPAATGAKLRGASSTLTTAGAGIGGVGGYNFAAYTNAEAKKRNPVSKGTTMLDFGLDGVKPGRNFSTDEVSKAMTPEEKASRRQARGIKQARGAQKKAVGTVLRAERIGRNAGAVGTIAAGAAGGYALARKRRKKLTYGKDKVPVFKASREKMPNTSELVTDVGGVPQQDFKPSASYQRPSGRNKSTQGITNTGATKINSRPQTVYKAYDPERNRQRRLDHYSTAAAVGAGAAGAGAGHYGAAAYRSVQGQHIPKFVKMGAKNAGRSAGLGAAAVGGAIAADKIRSYKKSRGGSYSPLRSTGI